ncbi:hypothetical protein BGX26_000233 [Mortierella sp. AD094]|nr:hypothetical protein BGX26_000233 [Mortierella sp. AD094]
MPSEINNRVNHLDLPEHRGASNAVPLSPIRHTDVNKHVDSGYNRLHNLSLSSDEDLNGKGTGRGYVNINSKDGRTSSVSSAVSSKENINRRSHTRNLGKNNKNNDNSRNSKDNSDDTTVKPIKKRKPFLSRLRFKRYDPKMWEVKGMGRLTQFSNERLYMHWIRFGVLQGSIAITLLNFVEGVATWVGVGTLLLALLTLIYGTTLYHKRHLFLVSKRQDVKYFARTIPTILAIGLFLMYGGNFALILLYGDQVTSPMPWTPKDDGNFGHYF